MTKQKHKIPLKPSTKSIISSRFRHIRTDVLHCHCMRGLHQLPGPAFWENNSLSAHGFWSPGISLHPVVSNGVQYAGKQFKVSMCHCGTHRIIYCVEQFLRV